MHKYGNTVILVRMRSVFISLIFRCWILSFLEAKEILITATLSKSLLYVSYDNVLWKVCYIFPFLHSLILFFLLSFPSSLQPPFVTTSPNPTTSSFSTYLDNLFIYIIAATMFSEIRYFKTSTFYSC